MLRKYLFNPSYLNKPESYDSSRATCPIFSFPHARELEGQLNTIISRQFPAEYEFKGSDFKYKDLSNNEFSKIMDFSLEYFSGNIISLFLYIDDYNGGELGSKDIKSLNIKIANNKPYVIKPSEMILSNNKKAFFYFNQICKRKIYLSEVGKILSWDDIQFEFNDFSTFAFSSTGLKIAVDAFPSSCYAEWHINPYEIITIDYSDIKDVLSDEIMNLLL